MEERTEDFMNDWDINIEEKSARHKSGLRIGYDSTNEDGSLRLEYSGMSTFLRNTFSETKDMKLVEVKRNELTSQFLEIYKKNMMPQDTKNNEGNLSKIPIVGVER